MYLYLIIIFFSAIYLFVANFILKKFRISLDEVSKREKHKLLLRLNNSTPISGTFYFLPFIIVLFYKQEIDVTIICSLFFILGLLSDLKILDSYRLRLVFQITLLICLFLIKDDLIIYTRVEFFDNLMNYNFSRILICTFFFIVMINGYNLIDGTNSLCTLNFLLILIFIHLISTKMNIDITNHELNILTILVTIFFIFNFFGLNFLGDGAAYGIAFLLGYILVKISLIDQSISPYYIANLLWYPAFENLFSILRRTYKKINNYLPDNNHLHHLIFQFLKKKFLIEKNFLLSSLVGLIINFFLFFNYAIGYVFLTSTIVQSILIVSITLLYLFAYYILAKKLN